MGYLMGIVTVLSEVGSAYQDDSFDQSIVAPLRAFAICAPAAAVGNGKTLRDVFVAWIEIDPKRKDQTFPDAATNAFQQTWPCKERHSN